MKIQVNQNISPMCATLTKFFQLKKTQNIFQFKIPFFILILVQCYFFKKGKKIEREKKHFMSGQIKYFVGLETTFFDCFGSPNNLKHFRSG